MSYALATLPFWPCYHFDEFSLLFCVVKCWLPWATAQSAKYYDDWFVDASTSKASDSVWTVSYVGLNQTTK